MHEMSLIQEICSIVDSTIKANGGGHLKEVRLKVGELSAVEPDLMRFAWDAATRETPLEGASLVILWEEAKQVCPRCGPVKREKDADWLPICPSCGSTLKIESGGALDIVDITLEKEDDDG